MNRYAYCGNNPVRYVDPTGHVEVDYANMNEAHAAEEAAEMAVEEARSRRSSKSEPDIVKKLQEKQRELIERKRLEASRKQDEALGAMGAGGAVALVDSPAPGIADIVAVGLIASAGYRWFGAVIEENNCPDIFINEASVDGSDSNGGSNRPTIEDLQQNPPTHPDYKPPKKWDKKRVKNPNGPGSGWPHKNGDVWQPTDHKGTHAPHWDVQHPDGTHTPVYP